MSAPELRNKSLKDALLESVTAILSPVKDVRAAGEEQIKALEVTEEKTTPVHMLYDMWSNQIVTGAAQPFVTFQDEFGVYLCEMIVETQQPLAVQQLASVLLKQYVQSHWCSEGDKFRPPETSGPAKASIRQLLPMGLQSTTSKVRSSVAYALSSIASSDWPDEWPELFGILVHALTSGNPSAVHGAMRVLTEFMEEVTDTQMPQVAPVILPEMYKIFTNSEVYSIRTRSRAVAIFSSCAGLISLMSDVHKGAAKHLLFPLFPRFMEAFVLSLQVPDGHTSDSGLKKEVVQAITKLVANFPKTMTKWMGSLLPPIWSIFTQSVDIYIKTVIYKTEDADDPIDSDGEVLGFETLVYSVFEFIHGLIDRPKFRTTVKKTAKEIIYYILKYMQITEDQVKLWTANPDQFVEDEDDDTFSYSVRISAQDLLLMMCSEFKVDCANALCEAVTRVLDESNEIQRSGSDNWWKIHESLMLAVGSVKNLVIDCVKSGKVHFDTDMFLERAVLSGLKSSVSPFLVGRSLWLGSQLTSLMSPQLMQSFLLATVSGLQVTQPPCVRICAVRAVYGFCEHLKSAGNVAALSPYLSEIINGLVVVAQQFSCEVLALALEAMAIVLTVNEEFTATCEVKVAPLAIAVVLKYANDPLLIGLAQDVFKIFSENKQSRPALQERLVPTLVSILNAAPDKIPIGLPPIAIEMTETLVRSGGTPISHLLMNAAFPAVIQCTLRVEDHSALQNGGECLRAFVSVGLNQVMAWHDEHNNNGLHYIMQVISRLLDPKTGEFTASFVGRLVSMVISKVGHQLGENLDMMLRAVLSKMQQADSVSVNQSLLLIFAHLVHTQLDPVLDFLTSVPGPTGRPALEFVLGEWCARQHLFYGSYDGKVSTVALSKLLQHAISANDARFNDIIVSGDRLVSTGAVRTRSKTKAEPDVWSKIPVLVKIYKLLVHELSVQIEKTSGCEDEEGDEESDEEELDEDDEDGTDDFTGDNYVGGVAGIDDWTFDTGDLEDDDPDSMDDPINQINLQAYLTEYLQSLSQQPCFAMFCSHHTDVETQILKSIGVM